MSKPEVSIQALMTEAQCIWTASGDGLVGESASLWSIYTGQPKEAVQNWGWLKALHPDDRERARQLWQQAAEHKRFYETWYRIRNYKGVYHTFLLRCMPILQNYGTLREWICQLALATAEHALLEPDRWQTNLLSQLFVEQSPLGIVYVSIDAHFLHANDQFCSMVGYSREELIGQSVDYITHPEDSETSYGAIDQRPDSSLSSFVFEKRYIRKDGETIWAQITSIVLRLPSTEPLCFLGLIEDITERKQAEKEQERLLKYERAAGDAERREKEDAVTLVDQLRAVFETMKDGVIFRDREKRALLMNAAARRLLELGSEIDITEEPYQNLYTLYKVYDEHRRPMSIEQWPMSRILHGEVLSSEQPVDVTVHLPSGHEVVLGISGAPVYDRQGHMIGGVCAMHEITEARQKEHRTQQALNELLTIVEEVSLLPLQSDEPTDVVPVPPLHSIGQHITEIIRQVLQCWFVSCISIEQQTGSLHFLGVSGLTAQEERIYRGEVEQSSLSNYLEQADIARLHANEVLIRDLVTQSYRQPLPDFGVRYRLIAPMLLDEQLVGTLVVGQTGADIIYTHEEIALVKAIAKLVLQVIERVRLLNEWTTARANELALRETNRRFDSFLSIASHELRTPLTTIKGNVQLALRRMQTLKSQYAQQLARLDCYEQIIRGLERVHQPLVYATHRANVQERMINDLLDASRIHDNKLELVMQPCDLAEIVRQTVEDLYYIAPDRPVQLHLPEQGQVHILADADRIEQVVNNYLVNALRYSAPGRPIEVSLNVIEAGTTTRVTVQDQGSGIEPEDLEHIWERFYQSNTTKRQYTGAGLGLGLYISRSIMERHGGRVGVESVQGKGSTFWFTLPLKQSQDRHRSR